MVLPASQYSVLDAQRIERLDEDTFRCYVGGLKLFSLEVEPVITVSVTVQERGPTVRLLSTKLKGSPAVEKANDRFDATMSNVVRWQDAPGGGKQIVSDTFLQVQLQVPGWFVLPTSTIERTGCAVMSKILDTAVPRFLQQLAVDYAAWAAGDDSRAPAKHARGPPGHARPRLGMPPHADGAAATLSEGSEHTSRERRPPPPLPPLPAHAASPAATVTERGGLFKVECLHQGSSYLLGPFGSYNECLHVVDVLNIKAAMDAQCPLTSLRLHHTLGRYGVEDAAAADMRTAPFRQVVQVLQGCAQQRHAAARRQQVQAALYGCGQDDVAGMQDDVGDAAGQAGERQQREPLARLKRPAAALAEQQQAKREQCTPPQQRSSALLAALEAAEGAGPGYVAAARAAVAEAAAAAAAAADAAAAAEAAAVAATAAATAAAAHRPAAVADAPQLPPDLLASIQCPLSRQPMEDPVEAADGNTYDRAAIEDWIVLQRILGKPASSPLTLAPLASLELQPNPPLRRAIASMQAAGWLP
ncbi:hypothetical protein C2E20_7357 [Micractinium conductrix]|uniref:U-box domain-containing protein n=1 Tax=Micractinium conductrix TaxID=554055 RepID=A0A2P6V512_9CHLO|nr:hypothetical protein C2E20_7357 [Micractinium conductrix]|eukprot:PSC69180.1 hypothetical protein C2E20_7357 [Micractinium conductrix]